MKTHPIPITPVPAILDMLARPRAFSTNPSPALRQEPDRNGTLPHPSGGLFSSISGRSIRPASILFLLAGSILTACNDDSLARHLPRVIDTIAPGAQPMATDMQLVPDILIDDIDTLQPEIDLVRLRRQADQAGEKSPTAELWPLAARAAEVSRGRPPVPKSRRAIYANGNLRVFVAPKNKLTVPFPSSISHIASDFHGRLPGRHGPDTALHAVEAIPLFIINVSDSIVGVMALMGAIPAIQEALDRDGIWKPIEWWEFPRCGNSYEVFDLAPGELIVTRVYRYTGSFATLLRVKVYTGNAVLASAPFPGRIDPGQFDRIGTEREYFEPRWKEPPSR